MDVDYRFYSQCELSQLIYWVERKVFAFSKRWHKQTKKFLQGQNWKACDTLGDGNSKQWKLYNWLNIANIFKKKIDFSFEKRKNFPFNPIHEVYTSSKLAVSMQNLYIAPSVYTYDSTASNHCFVCLFRWWCRGKGRRGTNRDMGDRWVEMCNLCNNTVLLLIKEALEAIRSPSCVLASPVAGFLALCASIFTNLFCFSSWQGSM
jgi:hypothetical protein